MKNLKKVLALVMAFAMAFTMMAGAAYTDQDDIQATDAVELLATLNVMTGKGDGMFHPNDTITRAEICRIIYTIRNEGNDNANAYADMQTSFQDLTSADDWAKGYIKHCQSVGLISGRNEAGTVFGPQDPVTGVELAVICLRVLGYDPAKAGIGGESWSTKTIGLASEAGLLQGVNMESVTGPCERQWAAQIMANMLDAYTVTWSTDSDSYSRYGDNNALNPKVGKEYMKLYTSVGTLSSVSGGNLSLTMDLSDKADSDAVSGTSADNYAYAYNFTKVDKDYSSLLGQKVKVLFRNAKANEVIGVYALADNSTNTVEASGVESDGKKVKFGGKSYSIERIHTDTSSDTRNDYYNDYISVSYIGIDGKEILNGDFTSQAGVTYTATTADKKGDIHAFDSRFFDDWNTSSAMMQFVDSDNNGRFDSVIVTDYAAAEVTSATSTKIIAGDTYNYSDNNIDEGIAQGDWVSISWNRFDDCLDIKKIDVTTGKLDGFKNNSESGSDGKTHGVSAVLPKDKQKVGTGTVTVDKTTYNCGTVLYNEYRVDSAWFNSATDKDGHTDINTVKAGDSIEYILLNGAAWKVKRVGTGSLEDVVDVAMVVNVEETGFEGKRAKLQFFNDTTATVEIDNKNTTTLVPGTLYEYSVSGGKYTFEDVKNGATDNRYKDYYGDYTYEGTATYSFESGKRDRMGNKTIDDNAKVILFADNGTKTTNDSDVITGKQLKTLALSQITKDGKNILNDGKGEFFTADVSGLTRTAAIALKVAKLPDGNLESYDHYGYILSDAIGSGPSNEVEYSLLIEGGTEPITVYEKGVTSTHLNELKANTLIGYKSLAAEDSNGKRFIDDVKVYEIGDKNFGIAAAKVATNNGSAKLDGFGKINDSNVLGVQEFERDITANTVVFYVNSKDKEGTTVAPSNSTLSPLDYNANLADSSKFAVVDNGTKFANCLYLVKDSDDFEVLVIDYTDRMLQGPAVKDAIEQMGNPTIDVDKTTVSFAKDTTPDAINVTTSNSADKDITVSVDPSTGLTAAKSADKVPNSGKFTIALNSGKNATVGKYTVKVKVGDLPEQTIAVTVTGDAINNNLFTATGTWTSNLPAIGDNTYVDSTLKVTAAGNVKTAVKKVFVGTAESTDGNRIKLVANDKVKVVVELTAKDGFTFAETVTDANIPKLASNKLEGKFERLTDTTATVTYEYTVPATFKNADISGDPTTATKTINDALEAVANATVTLDTDIVTLPANVKVPEDATLVVKGNQSTLTALTGNGNVVFDGDIANATGADSLDNLLDSLNKVVPSVSAGKNEVAIDDGLKLSGTGEVAVWGTGESFSDMAAATGSTTVTPVKIVFNTTQAPAGATITATGTLRTAYEGSTTWPLRGAYSDTPEGFTVAGSTGDTAQLMVGDNCESITFTITKTDGSKATYTFTF